MPELDIAQKPQLPAGYFKKLYSDPELLGQKSQAGDGYDPAPRLKKIRATNTAYLAQRYGKSVKEIALNRSVYQSDFSKNHLNHTGPENLDEEGFYSAVNGMMKRQELENTMVSSLSSNIIQAWREGKDFDSSYETVRLAMLNDNGYRADHADLYRTHAQNLWQKFSDMEEEYSASIQMVADWYKKEAQVDKPKGRETGAEISRRLTESQAGRKQITEALALLPEGEAEFIIDMGVKLALEAGDPAEATSGVLKTFGRSTVDLAQGALESVKEIANRIESRFGDRNTRLKVDEERRISSINHKLQQRLYGDVDPVKGEGWIENTMNGLAASTPYLLVAGMSGGYVVNTLAFKNDIRNKFIEDGLSIEQANKLSDVAAPIYSGIEKLQQLLIIGKGIPKRGVFGPAGKTSLPRSVQVGGRVAGLGAAEFTVQMAEETLQQFTPATVQQIARAFSGEIPEVDWASEFQEYKDMLPETMSVMAVFSVIGTGAGVFRDKRNAMAYLKDKRLTSAIGFTDDQIDRIFHAKDPATAMAMVKAFWPKRELGTEKQKAALNSLNDEIKQSKQSIGDAQITKEADGFLVADAEGNPKGRAQTPEMAAVMLQPTAIDKTNQPQETLDQDLIDNPLPPDPSPASDQNPIYEDVVALNKESNITFRELFPEMADLPEVQRRRYSTVLQNAKAQGLDSTADNLAVEIIANPKTINADQHAGMVVRAAQLQNIYEETQNRLAVAYELGDGKEAKALDKAAKETLKQLDNITLASDLAGTEIGRALNIRKMRIARDTYSLANIVQTATLVKQETITKQEEATYQKLAAQIKESEARIEQLEKELAKSLKATDRENAESFVNEAVKNRLKVKKEVTKKRRDGYKKELAKLGYRLNDITSSIGLSIEAASLVSKIAETYVEDGANTLTAISSQLQKDLPDLSQQDIYNSLGGRIRKAKKKIETEIQTKIKELKQESAYFAKIHNALDGKFDKTDKKKSSERVKLLRETLNRLRLNAGRTIRNEAALARVHQKIEKIQDQLDGRFRYVPEKGEAKRPEEIGLTELRKEMRELERLMRTRDSIEDYKEQLRTGIYKISVPEQRVVKNEELEKALIENMQLKREVNNAIERSRNRTFLQKLLLPGNESRAALATLDLSGTLRQGAILSAYQPKAALKAYSKAIKAALNQTSADAIDIAIRRHKNQLERDRAGLELTSMDSVPNANEEAFSGNMIERIPGLGAFVKGSNRHMVTVLNLLRTNAFDSFIEKYPDSTLEQRRAWADFVNKASGRGSLGSLAQATGTLNQIFFAPKFAVSRFQAPLAFFKNRKDPIIRDEIGKAFLNYAIAGATVLALAKAAGADVGDDPSSSDFGKIIIGDTRFDLFAGFGQALRLVLSPVIATTNRTGLTDTEKNPNPIRDAMSFASYKLHPAITTGTTLATGKNIIGQEESAWKTLRNAYTPLIVQTALETWTEEQDAALTAAAVLSEGIGVGVNTYGANGPAMTPEEIRKARGR